MTQSPDPRRRAAVDRDGALRRLRRSTQVSVAVTLVLGGVFTALAAGSTHAKKIVRAPARRVVARTATITQAPAPPLVAVQSSAPAPAPAPAAPSSAPTPTYQPPVVVSGGS